MLLTWHNLTYYQLLMRSLREAIIERRLGTLADEVRGRWAMREEPP